MLRYWIRWEARVRHIEKFGYNDTGQASEMRNWVRSKVSSRGAAGRVYV